MPEDEGTITWRPESAMVHLNESIPSEFDESAVVRVDRYREELVGLSVDDASAMVRDAGFRPMVLELDPNVNGFALTGGPRRMRLYSRENRVLRAEGDETATQRSRCRCRATGVG